MAGRSSRALVAAAQTALSGVSAYLLTLLAAAAWFRHDESTQPQPGRDLRFLVLVPAHDEEHTIEATLAALQALDYPRDAYEVIVVADNCRDRTAAIASAAGATVQERHDPTRVGKPHALAWGLERSLESRPHAEAVVIVDADCRASPNLLRALQAPLAEGASAVQADYAVGNPSASRTAALGFAGFALMNSVRPRGKTALGLSCGLLGSGMAFARATLERYPWNSFLLAEDREYHNVLVAAGERVVFQQAARVTSPMPRSPRQSEPQQLRWEGGRLQLIRRWAPALISAGARRRDPNRLVNGLELLIPPQSLLTLANALLGLAALRVRAGGWAKVSVANLLAQALFVVGGLALVRAPLHVYGALLAAPRLIAIKVWIYARLLLRGDTPMWTRTPRDAVSPESRS